VSSISSPSPVVWDNSPSPGHAKHHAGLLDSANGDLYAGDAAGVYIPETGDLRPATPPPDFDLDVALASIGKFASLGPSRLLFSHYTGPADARSVLVVPAAPRPGP
jgi:glyoxylase-like metal-dependent hydrolase (beta-lactamase superfamily II)